MAARRGCAGDRGGEGVSGQNGAGGDVGLVLGGGGARGAYTSGALSVLLPELKDQVRVIVGTSAGALIASYLVANWHRPAQEAIKDGLSFRRYLLPGTCARSADGGWRRPPFQPPALFAVLLVSGMHGPSILRPEPLKRTVSIIGVFHPAWERTSASNG